MKKRISLLVVALAFMFNACGGGSDSTQAPIVNATQTTIDISRYCVANPTAQAIGTYLEIEAGDTIVKDENVTVVETYSDTSGKLRVCLVSGSAHLVR